MMFPAVSIVPAVIDAGQTYVKERLNDDPGIAWNGVIFQGAEWLFLGALAPITWFVARRYPIQQSRLHRALLAHAGGAVVLCLSWAALGLALGHALDTWVAQGPIDRAYLNWVLTSFPWSLFLYFTMLGSIYAFTYFDEARAREIQASRLSAQLAEARLGALRMQLHPHFLFNSLNAVAVLVRDQNTRGAARVVELLGEMLRELLRPDRPHEVQLSEELRFVERYLEVAHVRFSDRLRVEWNIDAAARDALVPDLLLQPIVENAVRHGVARRADAGRIEISAHVRDAVLELQVRDDGAGLHERSDTEGVGLSNTRERLRTLYGDHASLALRTASGGGAMVVITLPHRRAP